MFSNLFQWKPGEPFEFVLNESHPVGPDCWLELLGYNWPTDDHPVVPVMLRVGPDGLAVARTTTDACEKIARSEIELPASGWLVTDESIRGYNSGGNIMLDFVVFANGCWLVVSDDAVTLWEPVTLDRANGIADHCDWHFENGWQPIDGDSSNVAEPVCSIEY